MRLLIFACVIFRKGVFSFHSIHMDNIIRQNDIFFNRKQVEILEDGVLIKNKKLLNKNELFIHFEDIGLKVIRASSGKNSWLVATGIFLLLSIGVGVAYLSGADVEREAFSLYLLIAAFFAAGYFITYKRVYHLTNNDNSNTISFLLNQPSQQELEAFVLRLKQARKIYLLRKYGSFSKLISFEQQYNQLQWLYTTGTISTDEHEQMLSDLNTLFQAPNTITGFQVKR